MKKIKLKSEFHKYKKMMKAVGFIPVGYESSRLYGKALKKFLAFLLLFMFIKDQNFQKNWMIYL